MSKTPQVVIPMSSQTRNLWFSPRPALKPQLVLLAFHFHSSNNKLLIVTPLLLHLGCYLSLSLSPPLYPPIWLSPTYIMDRAVCLSGKSFLIHQSTYELGIPTPYSLVCMHAKSLQLWSILCNPKDHSPPGSCPWDSPGKNTGVGFHALLQGIFLTQGLNPRLLEGQAGSLPLAPPGKSLYSLGAQ